VQRICVVVSIATACGRSGPTPPERVLSDRALTLTGENYCVSCALAARGATTRCEFYGHHHALRIDSAIDPEGRPIDALIGDTVHYLQNDESAALVEVDDFHRRRVRVKGRLFVAEHTLAVESVEGL
jgi:hypothetical protein